MTGELYTRHFHNEADRSRFARFQDESRRAHFPALRSLCASAAAAAATASAGAADGAAAAALFGQPPPVAGRGSSGVKEGVAAARALFEAVSWCMHKGMCCIRGGFHLRLIHNTQTERPPLAGTAPAPAPPLPRAGQPRASISTP